MTGRNDPLGIPSPVYKDLKANIEAIVSPMSTMLAFATDTGEYGYYDDLASTWIWSPGGGGTVQSILIYHRNASTPSQYAPTWAGLTSAIGAFDPALDAVITIPPVVIVGTEIEVDKNVRISGSLPGAQSDTNYLIYHCTLVGRFNVWDGCRFTIENCYVVGPVTVGNGSTFTGKHCAFATGGTSIYVPDGADTVTVIIDQSVIQAEGYAVESVKTAGTLLVQLINSNVTGVITQDAYVDLEIYDGTTWDQRDVQKNSDYWAFIGMSAGFLTTAAHDTEHAEDIRDAALVRHTPRPTTDGNGIYADNGAWVEGPLSTVLDSVYLRLDATNDPLTGDLTTNENIIIDADNKTVQFGAGQDMSIGYDGTKGEIKTNLIAASDLHVATGAAKTLVYDTPVYEDLNFDVARSGGPAASQPDFVIINSCVHREFTSANNQFCGGVQEIPHHAKLSVTVYPHTHFFLKAGESAGTTGVTFTFYWELRQSTGITSGSVPLSATSVQLASAVGGYKLDIYDSTGFAGAAELGAQLACTISRTGGNAGDVVVLTYGVHYQKDTPGSRQLSAK
jgi:hypothetical protein